MSVGAHLATRALSAKRPGGTNTSGDENAVGVDGQGVDDGVVSREVLDEFAIGEHPLFDVVGGAGGKRVPGGRKKHFDAKTARRGGGVLNKRFRFQAE